MPALKTPLRAVAIPMLALFAAVASGQELVFPFIHTETSQNFQEIATIVRAITDATDISVDPAKRTLTLRGTPGQIAMAGWLLNELDKPATSQTPAPAKHEYRVPEDKDDVVRLFFTSHIDSVERLYEGATLVRAIGEIKKFYTYSGPKAVAVRGTAGQMALAEWLVNELDKPVITPGSARTTVSNEVRVNGSSNDRVRVFYLSSVSGPQQLQELATLVRATVEIRRLFTNNGTRMIAARGTPDELLLADWLLTELDKPVNEQSPPHHSAIHEYPAGGNERFVRIFYLSDTATLQGFQEAAIQIRSATKIRRVFTYNPSRALTLRGTSEQIAMAEQLIKERTRPSAQIVVR